MDGIVVRPVRAHEWREVRELRLRALSDEVAGMAFGETLAVASARPEQFWVERAALASPEAGPDAGVRQVVAVTPDGRWVGSVTVWLERAGEPDVEGVAIPRFGGGIVGVYVEPAHRGQGLVQRLLDAAVDWVRERGLDRARLYVHADNVRAQRAYATAGFRPTGVTLTGGVGAEIEMARDL